MIKFSLICDAGHRFDSWFANGGAFEALSASGHLSCALCGSAEVRKDVMAPRIGAAAGEGADRPAPRPGAPTGAAPAQMPPPSDPSDLKALKEAIERDSDYVGSAFVKEARAIHDGLSPPRSIYGEAKLEEARALLQDGVPVAPLPFIPTKKAN